jgi:hypothetical protein
MKNPNAPAVKREAEELGERSAGHERGPRIPNPMKATRFQT